MKHNIVLKSNDKYYYIVVAYENLLNVLSLHDNDLIIQELYQRISAMRLEYMTIFDSEDYHENRK